MGHRIGGERSVTVVMYFATGCLSVGVLEAVTPTLKLAFGKLVNHWISSRTAGIVPTAEEHFSRKFLGDR